MYNNKILETQKMLVKIYNALCRNKIIFKIYNKKMKLKLTQIKYKLKSNNVI